MPTYVPLSAKKASTAGVADANVGLCGALGCAIAEPEVRRDGDGEQDADDDDDDEKLDQGETLLVVPIEALPDPLEHLVVLLPQVVGRGAVRMPDSHRRCGGRPIPQFG